MDNIFINDRSELKKLINNQYLTSIDENTGIELYNLSDEYWVYNNFLNKLKEKGWVRFSIGFKGAVYGKNGNNWCIKILGMGVGENPKYYCEKGHIIEHERTMLQKFYEKGFRFQPDVKGQAESEQFLINECGISRNLIQDRIKNNDILITKFINGIPFATSTGFHLDCKYDFLLMINNPKILFEIYVAMFNLRNQLIRANEQLLFHNDPVPPNIIFTFENDKIVAKLVDFDLSQYNPYPQGSNKNKPEINPIHVWEEVDRLKADRDVPRNSQTGCYIKTLDRHLMDENLLIIENIIKAVDYAKKCNMTDVEGISLNAGIVGMDIGKFFDYIRNKFFARRLVSIGV